MDDIVVSFGRVLKRLRLEKEMSQEQLGLAAGTSRNSVVSIELGQKQSAHSERTTSKYAIGMSPEPPSKSIQYSEEDRSPSVAVFAEIRSRMKSKRKLDSTAAANWPQNLQEAVFPCPEISVLTGSGVTQLMQIIQSP